MDGLFSSGGNYIVTRFFFFQYKIPYKFYKWTKKGELNIVSQKVVYTLQATFNGMVNLKYVCLQDSKLHGQTLLIEDNIPLVAKGTNMKDAIINMYNLLDMYGI